MYKSILKNSQKVYTSIILCLIMLFSLCTIKSYAYEESPRYILLYKNLYGYGERHSDILDLYCSLKSRNLDVLLLQYGNIEKGRISEDDCIVIIPYSFDSQSQYKSVIDTYTNNKVIIYEGQNIWDEETVGNKGSFIVIDKIYPFSDLNKLMDIADMIHNRGISPIFIVMPVYDNYNLEAYNKYIEVLKYISRRGGYFFIHEPIINEDGTYNMDPKPIFAKAVEEYRKRGLEIVGIKLSCDRVFSNSSLYQGLNLPFLLVTEQKGKVDTNLDLYKVTDITRKHLMITGTSSDSFDFFFTKDDFLPYRAVNFDINKDIKDLNYLLSIFHSHKIPVRDFDINDYDLNIQEDKPSEDIIAGEEKKSQLDIFKEREMEKIKGSNLAEEEQGVEGYDISWIIRIGVKIGLTIICLLLIYIYICRKLDIRKLFKN